MSLVMRVSRPGGGAGFRPQDRRGHARPRCSNEPEVIRAYLGDAEDDAMPALLEAKGLHAGYGETRGAARHRFRCPPGRRHRAARRQRRRQDHDAARASAAWCAAAARSVSAASASTARRPRTSSRRGVAHVPDGRGTFLELTVEENLRLGAYTRREREAGRADIRPHVRLFPAPEGAAAPAGRHAVGRRAADAGDRARAGAAPAPAAAGRAVVRPGAADRARKFSPSCAASAPRRRSASCWSSRTPRSRSISPTMPICWKPAASSSPARPPRSAATRRCAGRILAIRTRR